MKGETFQAQKYEILNHPTHQHIGTNMYIYQCMQKRSVMYLAQRTKNLYIPKPMGVFIDEATKKRLQKLLDFWPQDEAYTHRR